MSGSAAGEVAGKGGGGEAAEAGKSSVAGEDEVLFLRRGLAISMVRQGVRVLEVIVPSERRGLLFGV